MAKNPRPHVLDRIVEGVTVRRRRWHQYSLRTLLILITVICCGLGWVGVKVQQGRKQKEVVDAFTKAGGIFGYEYQYDANRRWHRDAEPPGPPWLRSLLGDDFFRNPNEVDLSVAHLTAADFKHLQEMTKLKWLKLGGTQVTDAVLDNLKGLPQLEDLFVTSTSVTDAGVKKLRQALPHCKIHGPGWDEVWPALPR